MADRRTGKARQGSHPLVKLEDVTVMPGGKTIYSTKSGQAAQKVLSHAAKNGERVTITVTDKAGNKHKIISNDWGGHKRLPGKRAGWVKGQAGRSASSLKGLVAKMSEQGDPAKSDSWGHPLEVDDIAEIEIETYA